MSKRKTFSLAVVLALGLAVCAPQSALGNRVLYESAPSTAATQPAMQPALAPADADSADDPQQPKHKENGFAHALAAPFRALAKLFGGQGTINVPSWSPDGSQVAFVSYQLVPKP